MTPKEAWASLRAGNERFVHDQPAERSPMSVRRAELTAAQHPHTVVFGCSDSRVAAEFVFDQGLGDVFVVRTAGHVVDTTVLGSIEYGVEVLGAPLIVVLGHDSCGAVGATAHTLRTGEHPPGFVRSVVDKVIPSIAELTGPADQEEDERVLADRLRTAHVRHTVETLRGYSRALDAAVNEGRVAIVGVEYDLAEGSARLIEVAGDVGEEPLR
ncbi:MULTISPECIES: carbonic anhydrase [unclassified Isoptericola]|uniref:carbonic anhydrase n=1 Tax=unclassified Isoptericola TaxID=2623355 RepID=UPI0027124528|nr:MULTISPECIES: carbonic anhydrase [unclassified Isoptericola]MDO8144277.1 carbonic anhydrase [Isoptericola sp. 178]MDO8148131.1 carbonic anhydrase [Isoptericola sp. b515]MDO8151608.1 carbonic anhydrase [Isoptericola sp. b408]